MKTQHSAIFILFFIAIVVLVGATLALSADSKSANSLQFTADSAALGGAVAFLDEDKPRCAGSDKSCARNGKKSSLRKTLKRS
jgi:hypothetical protein